MSDQFEAFELADGEKTHPLWLRLKSHLESELQRQRERNDRTQTEPETARIRGHIECLKALIRLGDARPLTGE